MDQVKEAENILSDAQPQHRDKINRGRLAQTVLDNEMFKDAIRAARDKTHEMFENSALDDPTTREHARLRIDVLQDIVGELTRHMKTGIASKTFIQGLKDDLAAKKARFRR